MTNESSRSPWRPGSYVKFGTVGGLALNLYSQISIAEDQRVDLAFNASTTRVIDSIGMTIAVLPDLVRDDNIPCLFILVPNGMGWAWAENKMFVSESEDE